MSDATPPVPGSAAPTSEPTAIDLEPDTAARSRTPFIVAAVVLVVLVVGAGIVAFVASRAPTGYTAEDQQKFLAACTAGSGEQHRSVCACIYDQLTAKVPYERYVAIDAELQAQQPPLRFPPEVDAIRASCVARTG